MPCSLFQQTGGLQRAVGEMNFEEFPVLLPGVGGGFGEIDSERGFRCLLQNILRQGCSPVWSSHCCFTNFKDIDGGMTFSYVAAPAGTMPALAPLCATALPVVAQTNNRFRAPMAARAPRIMQASIRIQLLNCSLNGSSRLFRSSKRTDESAATEVLISTNRRRPGRPQHFNRR